MLKAILFDLDDTLIDWRGFSGQWDVFEAPHLRYVFDYISQEIHPLDDPDRYTSEYLRRTRDAWAMARSNLRAPHLGQILVESAAALGVPKDRLDMQRCMEVYRWGQVDGTVVFPDVFEVLPTLRDTGLKFGIVTNAFQPMTLRDAEMRLHGLLDFFPDCRISAADVGYLKPHPTIFEYALKCLGTTAAETIFVGDNPVADIAGSQAAGLRAVLRVKQPALPLISGLVVPDAAINTLRELPPILDDWFPGWSSPPQSP